MGLQDKAIQVAIDQVKGYLYPTEAEQAAAYELLIELSTRTSSVALASTEGTIREALDSIAKMFDITRSILREHGAEASKGSGGNLSLAVIAVRVLNEVFRPVLSRWQPLLTDWEAQCESGVSDVEWERRWPRGAQCRAELTEMRSSIRAYLDTLSRIAGASAVADAVLSAPNSTMIPQDVLTESLDPSDTEPRRDMVRWLSPKEMFQTWRATKPANRSLAKMKQRSDEKVVAEGSGPLPTTVAFDAVKGRDFWFDYVADTGDGFDGTAPVAWLVGRERIQVPDSRSGELPTPPAYMPRADLLVFGGDEVYPYASPGRYAIQTELPFRMGVERPASGGTPSATSGTHDDATTADGDDASAGERAQHGPALVAIPGNHDWLGGIEEFDQIFCAKGERRTEGERPAEGRLFAGLWETKQTEHWWHVKLPQGWWLWGVDTGLHNELVGPQIAYFTEAAKALEAGDRVILCTPVPLWQLRQRYRESYRNLRNAIDPLIIDRNASMPLCLSGDSHFFAHYERVDTDFDEDHITAGGGGAFLQPTHNLPERIPLERGNAEFKLTTRWPLPADSRAISPGAGRIFEKQYRGLILFAALLNAAFGALLRIDGDRSWLSSDASGDGWQDSLLWAVNSPVAWVVLVLVACSGVVALRGNSVEPKLTGAARNYGILIGLALAASLVVVAAAMRLPPPDDAWIDVAVGAVVGGVLSIAVFLSLVKWTNTQIKAADTLAFSPAYSTRFKHFLRFRIGQNGDLTCYVVGIDPAGEKWYEAMTVARPADAATGTPAQTSTVPPLDRAGIPRIHYVWGKTFPKFVPGPIKIAISMSDPDPNQPDDGLDAVITGTCTGLIDSGHTLMYGGAPGGTYTAKLRTNEQRRHMDNPNAEHHLINYVASFLWPRYKETDLMRGIECPGGERVGEPSPDEGFHPLQVARDLTAMREQMTADAHVRIIIGGADAPDPKRKGQSWTPGVVEEAYLAVESGLPLIVAGGFGGAAGLIADAILDCLDPARLYRLTKDFVGPRPRPDGTPDLATMVKRFNSPGVLRNGLSHGENRELLTSNDPDTVLSLINRSVMRISSHHAG